MTLTPEQLEQAKDLIRSGRKLEAVKLFKNTLNIDLKQAAQLADKLSNEMEPVSIQTFKTRFGESMAGGAKIGRIVGLIFMTIGLMLLAGATYSFISNNQFEKHATRVKGKVVDFNTHESSDDDGGSTTMYAPVFEYVYNGQSYQQGSNTSSSSPSYDIGEEVEIMVNPNDPTEILVDTFWEKWFIVVLLGFMGTMFTGMGYMAYRLMGK